MQIKLELKEDLKKFSHETHLRLARGARSAAVRMQARAKIALRQDVRRAGLGDKLANTWRVEIYPKSASARTHSPAVAISSKAPELIMAHGGMIIHAKKALWLAIPTSNVPRRGKKPATPEQVEAIYDQDLIFIRGMGRRMLAFVDKRLRGRLKRWRKRGSGGQAPSANDKKLTLMFVMVPQVRLPKRLNTQQIFNDLEKDWKAIFPEEINNALAAGSN